MNGKRLFEYFLLVLAIIFLLIHTIIISGEIFQDFQITILNLSFQILGILSVYYVTYFFTKGQERKNQKKLARTAIRHLRGNGENVIRLESIIRGYLNNVKGDALHKQELSEIKNHLISIKESIYASEDDFKEIVGEWLEEDRKGITKIHSMIQELKEAQQTQEQHNKKEIKDIKFMLSKEISNLPIGYPSLTAASSTGTYNEVLVIPFSISSEADIGTPTIINEDNPIGPP